MAQIGWQNRVQGAIEPLMRKGADVARLADELRQLKDQGCPQGDAYEALQHLRGQPTSEKLEDQILELMDIVVGWCPPHMRIWMGPLDV